MLQDIGRVATPKLVSRNYLRYLQTTLIMGGRGLVSEFMSGGLKRIGKVNKPNKRHLPGSKNPQRMVPKCIN